MEWFVTATATRPRKAPRGNGKIKDIPATKRLARAGSGHERDGARVGKKAPIEGRVNPGYRWAVLVVSVVAQAVFLGVVFQGLPVLGPVLRSA